MTIGIRGLTIGIRGLTIGIRGLTGFTEMIKVVLLPMVGRDLLVSLGEATLMRLIKTATAISRPKMLSVLKIRGEHDETQLIQAITVTQVFHLPSLKMLLRET